MIPKIIAIAGNAGVGKDTFYKEAAVILKKKGYTSVRFAFADGIKKVLNPVIFDTFGFNIDEADKKQKNLIRPILVSFGCAARDFTEGQVFIDKIEKKIVDQVYLSNNPPDFIFITDLRFAEYDYDEADFIKKHHGIIVYLDRIDEKTGVLIPPANEKEISNNRILKERSDYVFTLKNMEDIKWAFSQIKIKE